MKKWQKKMKQIMAFVLTLILVGTNGNMRTQAAETAADGEAAFTEVATEADLHAAIKNGENVKLTADIALVEYIYITTDSLILDLNGQTISGPEDDFSVYVNASGVILRDSSVEQTGGIQNANCTLHIYSGKECTIESGSYSGLSTITNDGTLVINGGSIYNVGGYSATVRNSGTVILNGGRIYTADDTALITFAGSTTIINGGEFLPKMDTNTEPEEGDISYGGGTLVLAGTNPSAISVYNGSDGDVSVGSLEDADAAVQIPTATHRITDSNGSAVTLLSVGSQYSFEKIPPQAMWGASATDSNLSEGDLSEALSAAASDSSIQYIKLTDSLTGVQHTISGGVFTMDLNGKTVSGAENAAVFTVTGSGTAVSFTDSDAEESGKITAVGTDQGCAGVVVKDGASIAIEKGNYTGGWALLIVEDGGSAAISGGSFDNNTYAVDICGGNLTISGGDFKSGRFMYSGGTLDLSGVTVSEYQFYFWAVPEENQISIPDGYVWVDAASDEVVSEINKNDWFSLVQAEIVTVSFDANGGSGTMAPVNIIAGYYQLPDCAFVAPDGLEFLGWATSADGKAINGSSTVAVTGDITLYAIWGKNYDLYVGGVGMEDGDYLASGATEVGDTQPVTGGYAYYKDGVLTLKDYVYVGEGDCYAVEYACSLYSKKDLEVKLEGENKLTNTLGIGYGILQKGDLTISGTGSLELIGNYYGICSEDYLDAEANGYVGGSVILENGTVRIDAFYIGIYACGDVTVNDGSLSISVRGYGISSEGEIAVNGGYVDIDADFCALYSYQGIGFNEDALDLLASDGGSIFTSEGIYAIADASGNLVGRVLIVPKTTHNWSADYDYNHVAHWHACMDADCFFTGNSSLYAFTDSSAYGEHDTDGENGVCSVCGYNTNKEIAVYVGGLGLAEGEYLNNSGKISTVQPADGGYAYYKEGVLTLNNYVYEGEGYIYGGEYSSTIYSRLEELEIVLQGENQLTNTKTECDGITMYSCSLTISGTGSLKIVADYGIYVYEVYDENTGELIGGSNVTIEGGTITVDAGTVGIGCESAMTIDGGNITIDAYGDGIALYGKLVMNAGTLDITTGDDDGIDMDAAEDIIINGGSVTIHTDDKGIDSVGNLIITGGTVNITSDTDDCADVDGGITISGGTITLNADDDGLRSDEDILIEGGRLTVNAGDHGIFSYANLTINGGVITLASDATLEMGTTFAIKVAGELILGEQVELLKPEGGKIDTLRESTDTADVYEYYQIVVDGAGNMATYVVIKEKGAELSAEEQVKAFVERMYTVALNRDAEEEGCEWWTQALLNGDSDGAGLAYGFLLGDEFKAKGYSDEKYVAVLYDTFFDREVAEGEGDFWINSLAAGVSRESVLSGFVNSEEFFNLCAEYGILRGTMLEDGTAINPGIGKFAERLYTEVLGRAGEEGGMEFWATAIATGGCTPKDAAKNFFTSDEYLAKNTNNNQYLVALYRTFMGRDGDVEGLNFWLMSFNTGAVDRVGALSDFADSEEFRMIMASYGL